MSALTGKEECEKCGRWFPKKQLLSQTCSKCREYHSVISQGQESLQDRLEKRREERKERLKERRAASLVNKTDDA